MAAFAERIDPDTVSRPDPPASRGKSAPPESDTMEKLLSSMEQILEMEEKNIRAMNALEARLTGENRETLTDSDLENIKAEMEKIEKRSEILIDSFDRIDNHLKKNGF